MPASQKTDSTRLFKQDSVIIIVSRRRFNPSKHKLKYHKNSGSQGDWTYLETINGKEIWGTDGGIPIYEYGRLTVILGTQQLELPVESVFEPNLYFTNVNRDRNNNTLYITAINSDGAGAYAIIWVIENGVFLQRLITIPF